MGERKVSITQEGRSGSVTYAEDGGRINGWWEFGGGDAVTLISMGSREEWRTGHTWALGQRAAILSFVAGEVLRQKAPGCRAEIDEESGLITVYQGPAQAERKAIAPGTAPASPAARKAEAAAFVRRFTKIKAMFGVVVLAAALLVGAVYWLGKKVLTVASASAMPMGECFRTDHHIATLLQSTDPHLPEITGRGAKTTTTVSLLLIPIDGSAPHQLLIGEGFRSEQIRMARILGNEGRVLWFDVNGLGGADLERHVLLDPSEIRDPQVPRSGSPFPPGPDNYLSAGFIPADGLWFGLHAAEELQVEYAPGKFVRKVVSQEDRRRMRRLYRGTLEAPADDKYHRIVAMEPVSDAEFFNAAFLRLDDRSEPLRLSGPDGVLMLHTSEPGLKGTAIVSRMDLSGKTLWSVNTAIDRFNLKQILPGPDAFAFVGARLPVPGKVSEPLLVLVENATGKTTTHSLWR